MANCQEKDWNQLWSRWATGRPWWLNAAIKWQRWEREHCRHHTDQQRSSLWQACVWEPSAEVFWQIQFILISGSGDNRSMNYSACSFVPSLVLSVRLCKQKNKHLSSLITTSSSSAACHAVSDAELEKSEHIIKMTITIKSNQETLQHFSVFYQTVVPYSSQCMRAH